MNKLNKNNELQVLILNYIKDITSEQKKWFEVGKKQSIRRKSEPQHQSKYIMLGAFFTQNHPITRKQQNHHRQDEFYNILGLLTSIINEEDRSFWFIVHHPLNQVGNVMLHTLSVAKEIVVQIQFMRKKINQNLLSDGTFIEKYNEKSQLFELALYNHIHHFGTFIIYSNVFYEPLLPTHYKHLCELNFLSWIHILSISLVLFPRDFLLLILSFL